MKLSRSIPWKAAAAAVVSLLAAGCTVDTSTPTGWQSRGPRSSAELPVPVDARPEN